jgi:hypothetical protein
MEIEIKKSDKKGKRLKAVIDGKKTVHFGDINAKGRTFFDTGDTQKKSAYIARHKVNENWSDPKSAGFYAKHVLWNSQSKDVIRRSIKSNAKNVKSVKLSF